MALALLFLQAMQILERQRHPGGEWADETLPGGGPRKGESHPFDGLLRRIHRLLNPPRPHPANTGGGPNGSSGERGRWS
jgi:hypothetical protein